jgi:hypothetical protein
MHDDLAAISVSLALQKIAWCADAYYVLALEFLSP